MSLYENPVFETLSNLSSEKVIYWTKLDEKLNPTGVELPPHISPAQQFMCPNHISVNAAVTPKPNKRQGVRKSPWQLAQDRFCKLLKEGLLSDSQLKEALSYLHLGLQTIHMIVGSSDNRFFTGYKKGTKRYSKVMQSKMLDFCKTYDKLGWEALFITTTCDLSRYENPYEAWRGYKDKEVRPWLENLRKHMGAAYVYVLEATAKGAPHAHVMLFLPKGSIGGYEKMKNNRVLYYGKIYNTIRDKVLSPVFKIKVVKGEHRGYYISKYLSKAMEEDIFKLRNKQGAFEKSERKEVAGLVYPSLVNRRSVCMSTKKKVKRDSSEPALKVLSLKDYIALEKGTEYKCIFPETELDNARRLRRILNKLCTNSPLNCPRPCFSMSFYSFKRRFDTTIEDMNKAPPEKVAIFDELARNKPCAGCFWSHFYNFILTGYDEYMNIRINDVPKHKIGWRLFDYFDLTDDVQWFKVLKIIIDFYFTGIYVHGETFPELHTRGIPLR